MELFLEFASLDFKEIVILLFLKFWTQSLLPQWRDLFIRKILPDWRDQKFMIRKCPPVPNNRCNIKMLIALWGCQKLWSIDSLYRENSINVLTLFIISGYYNFIIIHVCSVYIARCTLRTISKWIHYYRHRVIIKYHSHTLYTNKLLVRNNLSTIRKPLMQD